MAKKNSALSIAKNTKKDEFYTQLSDIEKEMHHFRKHFKGKIVLCNCDDPFESNFFKYFVLNFNRLGLKKLIATSYVSSPIAGNQFNYYFDNNGQMGFVFENEKTQFSEGKRPYKAIVNVVHDATGNGGIDMVDVANLFKSGENTLEVLEGDGDFRSNECISILESADIVVTNPPFSLFREYFSVLMQHQKKFVIIGSTNAISMKEIFLAIQNNQMWLGVPFQSGNAYFYIPKGVDTSQYAKGVYDPETRKVKFRNCCWYTNLDINIRHEELILVKKYTPDKYPKYDNYDAIEVPRIMDIPCDYTGIMGVPITFMEKYNPDQFVILGRRGDLEWAQNECTFYTPPSEEMQQKYKAMNKTWRVQNTYVLDKNGIPQVTYGRIFIRYTTQWIQSHLNDFKKE